MKAASAVSPMSRSARMLDDEDLWDVARAARFLGVSRSWLYHRTEAGELPYRKIGALLRFVPAELRAWVDAQMGRVPRASAV